MLQSSALRPKQSKSTLEPIANTIAVANGVFFDYYPIKFGERKGDFVEVKFPPILREGYATFQKTLYKVSLRDIFRSRINVGQPSYVVPTTGNAVGRAITAAAAPAANVGNLTLNTGQPGLGEISGLQVDKAADLAFEEQIHALLHLEDPEAEWEF